MNAIVLNRINPPCSNQTEATLETLGQGNVVSQILSIVWLGTTILIVLISKEKMQGIPNMLNFGK